MINAERPTPPKRAFNTEYETQWRREHDYLKEHGFRTSFVKTDEYGIRTYKYKKSPELFFALSQFYSQVKYEKQYAEFEQLAEAGTKATAEEINDIIDMLIPKGSEVRCQ